VLHGELVLQSLHPGVSRAGLRAATGFEPAVADDLAVTEEPSAEMLRVLREEIDPLGIRRLEFAPARERAGLLAACIAAEQDLIDRARCLSMRRGGAPQVKDGVRGDAHRGRAGSPGDAGGLRPLCPPDRRGRRAVQLRPACRVSGAGRLAT
jgi:hypothetical protein